MVLGSFPFQIHQRLQEQHPQWIVPLMCVTINNLFWSAAGSHSRLKYWLTIPISYNFFRKKTTTTTRNWRNKCILSTSYRLNLRNKIIQLPPKIANCVSCWRSQSYRIKVIFFLNQLRFIFFFKNQWKFSILAKVLEMVKNSKQTTWM